MSHDAGWDKREDASTFQLGNVTSVDAKILQPLDKLERVVSILIRLTLSRLCLLGQGLCFCS